MAEEKKPADNRPAEKKKKKVKKPAGRFKFFRSLRFRIMVLLFVMGIVPAIVVETVVVKSYETRAISQRTVIVKNQCDVLANQLIEYDYLDNPRNAVIDGMISQLTSIYGGRIMVINRDYKVIKDTFDLDNGKFVISPEIIRCFEGEDSSNYDKKDQYIQLLIGVSAGGSSSDTETEAAAGVSGDSAGNETVSTGSAGDVQSGSSFSSGDIVGVILVSVSTMEIDTSRQILESRGITILGFCILLILIFGYLASGLLMRPFQKITNSIEALNSETLDAKLDVPDYLETELITTAFNHLLDRVKAVDDSRSEFVSNVSHELKTPLTSMKVLADALNTNPDVPIEQYRDFMEDISAEIDRENKIITDLLSLVRMDKDANDLNIEETNINEELEDIVRRLRPIADQKNVELILDSFRPVNAEVDDTKLSLAFTNIIENAIKYNKPEGGWVRISMNADRKYFYVTISDSGIGIPEDQLDHIFERFYRVDKSHSREIGGTGLGLAITKSAIAMHHGAINVRSTPGEGTTFSIRVPLVYVA